MKKNILLFLGLSMAAMSAVPFAFNNDAKAANAAPTYDHATDVIDNTFLSKNSSFKGGTSYPQFTLTADSSSNEYWFYTKKGSRLVNTAENKAKNACFFLEEGSFGSSATGIISRKTIGYVRSVSIEFGDYSVISGNPGTVDLYGSNDDDLYTRPTATAGVLYQEDGGDVIYSFDLDHTTVNLSNLDYKYIGFRVRDNTGEVYLKSITIDWELRDFDAANPIYIDVSNNATRIEETSGLKEGDIVFIVFEDANNVGRVLSDVVDDEGYVGRTIDCDVAVSGETHTISNYAGGEYFYVTGNEDDGFVFTSFNGEVISFDPEAYAGGEGVGLASGTEYNTWSVTIDSGYATIVNDQYPDAYLTYDTSYECYDAMSADGDPCIYKVDLVSGEDQILLDDKVDGKSPALNFARKFLNEMSKICDYNGVGTNTDNLAIIWNQVFSSSCDEYADLSFISFLMFEYATPVEDGGDDIQQAVALYDYIVGKYGDKIDDVLNRAPAASRIVNENTSSRPFIAIGIVMFSALAALSFLSYTKFKKHENN